MKKALILAGGTATAWHIADVIRRCYGEELDLLVCDINPPYLVHTSVLADKFIRVPPIREPEYYQTMLKILEAEQIDVMFPLIDDDILLFPADNPDLKRLGVVSAAPPRKTVTALSNKANLQETLSRIGVRTPKVISSLSEIRPDREYFIKDKVGCGSKGAHTVLGKDISSLSGTQILQELCGTPEITVDAVNDGGRIHTVCRERIEIKLGVSTKCRVFFDEEIQKIVEKIAASVELPAVFCIQFMTDPDGRWSLTDFNLRSGGGSAISAAVGFEAVRAAVGILTGLKTDVSECLRRPDTARYVVRTYREVVTQ